MEYQKSLGPIRGIAMTVTTFIGAGLMFLPALSVAKAGSFAIYAWLATIILALPIAFVFASLGSRYPSPGGASHYIGLQFGPIAQKSVGWLFLSILLVGPAVAVKIAAAYLLVVWGISDAYLMHFTILTVALLCFYSLLGVDNSSKIQLLIVTTLTLCVALLAFQGNVSDAVNHISLPKRPSDIEMTLLSVGTIFWCFLGIEVMAHMGAEFKNPRRDFPIALLGGVTIVIVLYVTVVLMIYHYGTFGDDLTNSQSLALLVGILFNDQSKRIFALGAFIIIFMNVGTYILGFSRMVQSMAENRALPSFFVKLSANGVPRRAVVVVSFVCLISIVLAHFAGSSIGILVEMTNGAFVLIYALTCLTATRLLKGKEKVTSYVASLACLLIIYFTGEQFLFALGVLSIAFTIEFYKERKSLLSDSKIHVQ